MALGSSFLKKQKLGWPSGKPENLRLKCLRNEEKMQGFAQSLANFVGLFNSFELNNPRSN